MKTLIAAVIASAVSFGAFAQPASAPASKAPMAAGDSSMKHTAAPKTAKTAKTTPAPKSSKSHTAAAKKPAKKASAPAA